MQIVTFRADRSVPAVGILTVDRAWVVDLARENHLAGRPADPDYADALSFLVGGDAARERAQLLRDSAREPVPLESVELLSPVPRPLSIRDCLTFEAHLLNIVREVMGPIGWLDAHLAQVVGSRRSIAGRVSSSFYRRPGYYMSNTGSVVGSDAVVRIPYGEKHFDYELEWGVFIGKRGVDIPAGKAHEYIAGYTVFNDFTARDAQFADMKSRLGPTKGKDFDTGNAIGPWLVTPDEIADPYNLTMIAKVNGKEWSRGSTSDMYYSFEELIAYISRSETLYPGDFIGSGTCSGEQGRGCGLELGRYLQSGDTVELEVEHVGILRNRVY